MRSKGSDTNSYQAKLKSDSINDSTVESIHEPGFDILTCILYHGFVCLISLDPEITVPSVFPLFTIQEHSSLI